MNKTQLIAPLVAIALFVLVLGLLQALSHSHDDYRPLADRVGRDLVSKTNSDLLTSLSPQMRSTLVTFLASPGRSDGVVTEPEDIHGQTPTVYLLNEAQERFALRLRWEKNIRKFTPVDYTYPAPWPPTNWTSRPYK